MSPSICKLSIASSALKPNCIIVLVVLARSVNSNGVLAPIVCNSPTISAAFSAEPVITSNWVVRSCMVALYLTPKAVPAPTAAETTLNDFPALSIALPISCMYFPAVCAVLLKFSTAFCAVFIALAMPFFIFVPSPSVAFSKDLIAFCATFIACCNPLASPFTLTDSV